MRPRVCIVHTCADARTRAAKCARGIRPTTHWSLRGLYSLASPKTRHPSRPGGLRSAYIAAECLSKTAKGGCWTQRNSCHFSRAVAACSAPASTLDPPGAPCCPPKLQKGKKLDLTAPPCRLSPAPFPPLATSPLHHAPRPTRPAWASSEQLQMRLATLRAPAATVRHPPLALNQLPHNPGQLAAAMHTRMSSARAPCMRECR